MGRGRTLMAGGRRYLAAILLALLSAPAVGMVLAPYQASSVMERRALAPVPIAPRRAADWAQTPRAVDAWLRDHLAWREVLLKAGLKLRGRLGLGAPGPPQAVRGSGDWLLLSDGLLGAAGAETSLPAARRYAAFACRLARTAKQRGEGFLFVPIPGPVEIYPEALPGWLPPRAPTQPGLVLRAVRACGVQPLDLRPAMIAAKGGEKLYQHHDSHWTNAGALLAFDETARALHQPWAIAPADMHWSPGKPFDSDLVRLMGLVGEPQELAPEPPEGPDLAPSAGVIDGIDHAPFPPPFLVPGRPDRPKVLIVGDSYSANFIEQYFRKAGVTLAWIHQADCRFDRRILDKVKPDVVVLMPASREEACAGR